MMYFNHDQFSTKSISSTRKGLSFMPTAKRLLFCCLFFSILVFTVIFFSGYLRHVSYLYLGVFSDRKGPDVVLLEEPRWYILCADVPSIDSRPCLCYYDSVNIPKNYTVPDIASIGDKQLIRELRGRCAITVNALGRLGNLMGEYATIYALARRNRRPAFMLTSMANVLLKYFNVTMPILSEKLEKIKKAWSYRELHFWMEDEYTNLADTFLHITGYPYSWTYFHHLRDEILREFAFSEDVVNVAQKKLLKLQSGRKSVTYVGVHARRSDYINVFKQKDYRGVLADEEFFRNATNYFRSKFPDAIFVVASDDLTWCEKNFDNSKKDVYFVGNRNISNPIEDMALLANCNHSIITIGTYGFWAAYLAGGETVHFTNYSKPGVYYDQVMRPDKLYLPNWVPIAANRSSIR